MRDRPLLSVFTGNSVRVDAGMQGRELDVLNTVSVQERQTLKDQGGCARSGWTAYSHHSGHVASLPPHATLLAVQVARRQNQNQVPSVPARGFRGVARQRRHAL